MSLAISSNGSFLGVPPYFLVAFELGGIPTQANIGSDYGNLSWKADHKRGMFCASGKWLLLKLQRFSRHESHVNNSRLARQRWGPSTFVVHNDRYDYGHTRTQRTSDDASLEGSDTSCIASPPQNLPVITSNVTDDLGTCDPWGLLIAGGTKPYSLYLTALTASVITIVEMGANDNLYTYINRAAPGTLLSGAYVLSLVEGAIRE